MRRTLSIVSASLLAGGIAGYAFAERQPHMKAALAHLEAGQAALEKATADKGGHRVKAIALVKEAIAEVKAGIEYDDKR